MLEQTNERFLYEQNYVLIQETSKNWFFWFFRAAVKRFEILLYNCDDAETQGMATQIVAQGVATIKQTFLS